MWHDIWKETLDPSKASKRGRLGLVEVTGPEGFRTVSVGDPVAVGDLLVTVFEDGKLLNETTFDEVRERAAVGIPGYAPVS